MRPNETNADSPHPAAYRRLLCTALALVALCGPGCGRRHEALNVLLISVDTLRSDHVGSYGYARATTPNLDRFFRRGTVYEVANATAPCTVPSVRQLLSGGFDVREERAPLAEVLRDHGYATAAVASQHHFVHHRDRDYARGFEHFDLQGDDERDHHGLSTRTADQVSDRALAWLARRDRSRPFFLWLHYIDPHDPYEPPPEHRVFDDGEGSTRSGDRRTDLMAERRSPDEPWVRAGYIYDEADVAHLRNLYDGEIRFVDAEIRRVLERLVEEGLVGRSIVAFTADHGEWLGEGGWWDHCITLRDEEIRVPLMIRVGDGPVAGRGRDSRPASTLDLVPTILGILGLPVDRDAYPGVDLRDGPADRIVQSTWGGLALARNGGSKLYLDGDREIFEPSASLAPDAAAAAREALRQSLAASSETRRRVATEWQSTVEELRALGYVE